MKRFSVTLFGDVREERELFSPQRRPYHELFFVTSGHLVRTCNFNSIRLNKNELHLSLEQQATQVESYSDDLKAYYCRFEGAFLEQVLKDRLEKDLELISSFLVHYPVRLTAEVSSRLEFIFSILLKLQEEGDDCNLLITTYLLTIIYEVKKLMVKSQLNFYPSKAFLVVKQYNDLLAANIDKERSLIFYAKQLKITPNHLNKLVKTVTGHTAISLLNEMMVLEARLRLKTTNLTINEIAYSLGFEDQSYFSRFFKKTTGFSPNDYRKKIDD